MKFKIRNALIGCGGYIYLVAIAFSSGLPEALVFIAYIASCMLCMNYFITNAEKRRSDMSIEFSRWNAFDTLGVELASFIHVFQSTKAVTEQLKTNLSSSFNDKLYCTKLDTISFTDLDKDFDEPETRSFFRSTAPRTRRDTAIIFICTFTNTKDIQGIRWWIIASGERDPNKVFWKYIFSPLTIPFIIIPYIRREHDPLVSIVSIHNSFFNSVDILSRTREIQFIAFDTLISTLESFGIDTSDLKTQKINLLNINVTGGKTTIGSIVQGALNKVSSTVGGHESEYKI